MENKRGEENIMKCKKEVKDLSENLEEWTQEDLKANQFGIKSDGTLIGLKENRNCIEDATNEELLYELLKRELRKENTATDNSDVSTKVGNHTLEPYGKHTKVSTD